MQNVNIEQLKPHPKNGEYWTDLSGELYEAVKRSIVEGGIRDPLVVLPDYTVLCGHQRLRIATEIGLKSVPVVVRVMSDWDAEYLLIADNFERRGGDKEPDPIKRARQAEFLTEYWGVQNGGDKRAVLPGEEVKRTAADVAKAVGVTPQNLPRLVRLGALEPELQDKVSEGRVTVKAGYELSHTDVETQQAVSQSLLDDESLVINEDLAKEIRKEARREGEQEATRKAQDAIHNYRKTLAAYNERIAKANDKKGLMIRTIAELKKECAELKRSQKRSPADVSKIAALEDKIAEYEEYVQELQKSEDKLEKKVEQKEKKIESLEKRLAKTQRDLEVAKDPKNVYHMIKQERVVALSSETDAKTRRWLEGIAQVLELCEEDLVVSGVAAKFFGDTIERVEKALAKLKRLQLVEEAPVVEEVLGVEEDEEEIEEEIIEPSSEVVVTPQWGGSESQKLIG